MSKSSNCLSAHPRVRGATALLAALWSLGAAVGGPAAAQERLPWQNNPPPQDTYGSGDPRTDSRPGYGAAPAYGSGSGYGSGGSQGYARGPVNDAYRPPSGGSYDSYRPSGETGAGGDRYYDDRYRSGDPPPPPPYVDTYRRGGDRDTGGPGEAYAPPRQAASEPYERGYAGPPRDEGPRHGDYDRGTYSQHEIVRAGHGLFGSVSASLASVIEYAFKRSGRPNGYILGEDAGGAFVAGLRYGEGTLHTKDAGSHKVYWQGPSVGYDFGAEGSKTMVLVYNLRDVSEIYNRFGGVQGSAYVVGGVGIQFQKYGEIVLAPIRSGVGLRLGANVGYLKYTRRPTWNPF